MGSGMGVREDIGGGQGGVWEGQRMKAGLKGCLGGRQGSRSRSERVRGPRGCQGV